MNFLCLFLCNFSWSSIINYCIKDLVLPAVDNKNAFQFISKKKKNCKNIKMIKKNSLPKQNKVEIGEKTKIKMIKKKTKSLDNHFSFVVLLQTIK